MVFNEEAKRTFDWKELHKKVVRIVVAEPNPECLEFIGQVFAMDIENGKTYVLHEWNYQDSSEA